MACGGKGPGTKVKGERRKAKVSGLKRISFRGRITDSERIRRGSLKEAGN